MRQVIFKLDEYPEIQFKGGSADGENLRGCYIEIKGCLESKMEDHNKNIFRFKKKLNHTVERFLSDSILSKKFIRTDIHLLIQDIHFQHLNTHSFQRQQPTKNY